MHEDFHFKQFVVKQDRCAMKVGTDGVLLGAWVQTGKAKKILDIGTGTGLIALMLAQKSAAQIDAIEIDRDAYEQAKENFENSRWASRLHVFHKPLQQYAFLPIEKYDLIISNPPFFSDAYKAPSEARNVARHTDHTLSFDDLIDGVKKLLQPRGKLFVILPSKEGGCFIELAAKKNLFVHRLTRVKTKIDKHEKRLLIEMGFERMPVSENDFVIQEEDLSFTKEYIELTKDFYLGLKADVRGLGDEVIR